MGVGRASVSKVVLLRHNPPGDQSRRIEMRQCLAILAFLLFPAHLAGAIAAEPAQAHIAFLGTLPRSNLNEARALGWFTDRLREHGWVEGQNLTLTYRASEGVNERYAELAAELIAKHPDVIVAEGPEAVQAIEQRTKIGR